MSRLSLRMQLKIIRGGTPWSRYFYIRDGTDLTGARDWLALMCAKRCAAEQPVDKVVKGLRLRPCGPGHSRLARPGRPW
jgi:hypothetical protein